ncbi:MAG: flagellar basal body-associated FliL family protein [Rhodospirillales bacterium]|nr:flagellar basal body-associated FliL family protein [Rhodospirillales bacterium]
MSDTDDEPRNPEPTLDGDGGGLDDDLGGGGGLDAKKIILFVLVPLFLLAGIGGGLYFTGTLDKLLGGKGEQQHAGDDGHAKKKKDDGHGGGHGDDGSVSGMEGAYFLEIPDMTVNLNAEGETRYLRLSVQLELESQSDAHAIEAVMPRVVDQFQTYLRELRVRDLRGSQGIYRLQMELLARVNAAAYPVEVKDVLFQEILIQ